MVDGPPSGFSQIVPLCIYKVSKKTFSTTNSGNKGFFLETHCIYMLNYLSWPLYSVYLQCVLYGTSSICLDVNLPGLFRGHSTLVPVQQYIMFVGYCSICKKNYFYGFIIFQTKIYLVETHTLRLCVFHVYLFHIIVHVLANHWLVIYIY